MRKMLRRIGILLLVVVSVWLGGVLADRQRLREDILRLHVVGASDSAEDQQVKLRVRDAVLATLEEGLADLKDLDQAAAYVEEMLPRLEQTANRVLEESGFREKVTVSLGEEAFPMREYDSFSLPAGVYQALRVVIGDGAGKNWWCVVFPQLCLSATAEEFDEVSAFSDTLNDSLTGEYEIRFWVLDKLGELENFLWGATDRS